MNVASILLVMSSDWGGTLGVGVIDHPRREGLKFEDLSTYCTPLGRKFFGNLIRPKVSLKTSILLKKLKCNVN